MAAGILPDADNNGELQLLRPERDDGSNFIVSVKVVEMSSFPAIMRGEAFRSSDTQCKTRLCHWLLLLPVNDTLPLAREMCHERSLVPVIQTTGLAERGQAGFRK